MPKFIDLTDRKSGRLTVIRFERPENKWLCKCECGNHKFVRGGDIRSGATQSCGCLQAERAAAAQKARARHGMWDTAIYSTWRSMINRCTNPAPKYRHWFGRGITVCERWKTFENFYADMGECPAGMSLDRIDNDRGYSPDNCRWATPEEQSNNTRYNRKLTLNGQSKTISQWAKERGVPPYIYYQRVYNGWDDERVLTQPIRGY